VDEKYLTATNAPMGVYRLGYYPHNVHFVRASAQIAGDGPPPGQVGTFSGMTAQAQAHMPIVSDDLATGGHRPDLDIGLVVLLHHARHPPRGGRPQFERLIAQRTCMSFKCRCSNSAQTSTWT
jgi:hypothetical protein